MTTETHPVPDPEAVFATKSEAAYRGYGGKKPWTYLSCEERSNWMRVVIAVDAATPKPAPAVPEKLWLWKNFVDGRPEYWAFDNPYPVNIHNGDPQTLGEPCGYALFKPSRQGRTDVGEAQVLQAIKRAATPAVVQPTLVKVEEDAKPDSFHSAGSECDRVQAQGLPFGIIDPDYARVFTQARIIAWQYGYACVMHGSFTRDLDLLLVPWEERARTNYDQLLKLIAQAGGLRFRDGKDVLEAIVDWSEKPHGRKACSLFFTEPSDRRWVDISVMPALAAILASEPAKAAGRVG